MFKWNVERKIKWSNNSVYKLESIRVVLKPALGSDEMLRVSGENLITTGETNDRFQDLLFCFIACAIVQISSRECLPS